MRLDSPQRWFTLGTTFLFLHLRAICFRWRQFPRPPRNKAPEKGSAKGGGPESPAAVKTIQVRQSHARELITSERALESSGANEEHLLWIKARHVVWYLVQDCVVQDGICHGDSPTTGKEQEDCKVKNRVSMFSYQQHGHTS